MHSVSIVGCGYTGLRLARREAAAGAAVRGFATRSASLAEIDAAGARPVPLDLDAAPRRVDCDAEVVFYSVPPAPHGATDTRVERFLEHVDGRPRRLVYLSTTGVYGDADGATVDEDTPPAPLSARAVRRLAAETSVRRWADAHGVSWCILRIPGIYGPGRLPLERLRSGEPAIRPDEAAPGNRIHVEDLAGACMAAGTAPQAHRRIYNVTDGSADSLTGYLQRVARLCGLPPPPLMSRDEVMRSTSPTSRSFLAESRRVDNRRMLHELGFTPAFIDLDEGIRASL
jgi:nucleoside-diphosphate-sugar epimerase